MNPTEPQALTERARESLQDFLFDELERGVKRGFEISTDYPAFLADNNPAPPVYRAAKALTRQACRAWARGQTPVRGPAADAVYGPLCEPYLESIGEMPGDGELARPFDGGQCDGVYVVQVRAFANQSGNVNATVRARGPIGGSRVRQISGNNYDWELLCANLNAGANNCGPLAAGAVQWRRIGGLGSTDGNVSASVVSVSPCGFVDNCGSLPPVYTPPTTQPGLPPVPPVTVELPGIGPVAVDVEFNPDGTVTVSLPDLGIEVTKGDPSDTKPGDDLSPGDQGDPGSPQATGVGGESEGEAPEGYVLVGLLLNLLAIPPTARPYENEVYRGSCYVYMGGDDGLDQDFAGSMIRDGQFIFAERDNLTRWRVSANNGFNIRTTPYYRRAD